MMNTLKIKIKKVHPDAKIPSYATDGASCFDFEALEDREVWPGETVVVKTGLSMEIPDGYELQIRPRSGVSLKTTLRVSNSPGTVDADFRGEIGVLITNTSSDKTVRTNSHGHPTTDYYGAAYIKKGDRIAQGAICPVVKARFLEVDSLSETDRGSGGFGSTGK